MKSRLSVANRLARQRYRKPKRERQQNTACRIMRVCKTWCLLKSAH